MQHVHMTQIPYRSFSEQISTLSSVQLRAIKRTLVIRLLKHAKLARDEYHAHMARQTLAKLGQVNAELEIAS